MRKITMKILQTAIERLELCSKVVASIADDEYETKEKLPGNLKSSEKYDKMEENVNNLRLAVMQIKNAINYINEAAGF